MTVLAKNTFEWDVEHEYLPQIRHLAAYTERKIDIERWASLFKGRNRNTIKAGEIRKHVSAWAGGIGTERKDRHGNVIKGKKLSASTLNHRLSALSNFYELLNGKRGWNPVLEVERFQEQEKPIRVVSEAWLKKIVANLQPNVTGARLRCLIYTGMRPKQLERAQREDIDLDNGTVWVRAAKGGRTNLISLPEAGVGAFRDLIGFADNTTLHERFRHKWGQPIAQESANAALKRAALAAGYTGPITRYVFRHSFATLMLDKGASTRQVQQQLTHSSLELVEQYTKVQQSEGTKAVMAKIG
jgi:integrase/recombinase XerD